MRMSPIHPVQFIHRGFTSLQSRPTTHGRQQKRPGAQGTTRVSFFEAACRFAMALQRFSKSYNASEKGDDDDVDDDDGVANILSKEV